MAQPSTAWQADPEHQESEIKQDVRHVPRAETPFALKSRRQRIKTYAVLAPLIVLLILWLWLFRAEGAFKGGPNGESFEADFAMFYTAAQITRGGGNPYDPRLLYTTERTFMAQQHLKITDKEAIVRVGNPPLFFWALQPLTRFQFQPTAIVWMAFLSILSVIGFGAALRFLGWNKLLLPSVIFALMPQTVFGPFYGNIVCLVFAAVGVALLLLRRHPILAGMLLSLALMKPPVALPVVLLIVLFHPLQRVRLLIGFTAASAFFFVATLITTGWKSVGAWLHALSGYSAHLHETPDVASLGGLYVRILPGSHRAVVQAMLICCAVLLTAYWWWKHRADSEPPYLTFASLWFVWFLATPYAHFFDEVMLAIPILILVGRDGERVIRRRSIVALYLMLSSLIVVSVAPYDIQLLPIPLVGVLVCLLRARKKAGSDVRTVASAA